MINYDQLAGQFGGGTQPINYDAMASQFGGVSSDVQNNLNIAGSPDQGQQPSFGQKVKSFLTGIPKMLGQQATQPLTNVGQVAQGAIEAQQGTGLDTSLANLSSVTTQLIKTVRSLPPGDPHADSLNNLIAENMKNINMITQNRTQNAQQAGTFAQPADFLQYKNPAEAAGGTAAGIGELFVPGGQLASASNLAHLGEVAMEGGVLGKVAAGLKDVLQTPYVGQGISEAAKMGTLGLAQGEKPSEAGQQALLAGVSVPILDKALTATKKIIPDMGQWLEKVNLRLTPAQQANLGTKIDGAVKFIDDNLNAGTPEGRFQKAVQLGNKTEETFQSFLKNEAGKITVNRDGLIAQLNGVKEQFLNDRDYLAVERQIKDFARTLKTTQPAEIPLPNLNALKRSTFAGAFNQAGNKVLDDVEFKIGDVLKSTIEDKTKGMTINGKSIEDFNKMYGNLINAKKLLKVAQGRNQLGLIGRLITGLVGGVTTDVLGGGPIAGTLVGGATESIANKVATPVRTIIAKTLKYGAKAIPRATGVAVGRVIPRVLKP